MWQRRFLFLMVDRKQRKRKDWGSGIIFKDTP
jgi:hypothetical protein